MHATKLRLNVILLQDELQKVRAGYAADFDMARARHAADKDHRIAEDESARLSRETAALLGIAPGDRFLAMGR